MRFFSILALLYVATSDSGVHATPEEESVNVAELQAEEADILAPVGPLLGLFETIEREIAEVKSQVGVPVSKAFEPRLQACYDSRGFTDSMGMKCSFYTTNKDYCDDAAKFVNSHGQSAKDACCVCNGGDRGFGKGVFFIKSYATGHYIGIYKLTSPHVRMTDKLWSPYIPIEIVPLVNNEYALLSKRYGNRFISVTDTGAVETNHVMGDWERFKIIELSNGSVQFLNVKWNKYLTVSGHKVQTSDEALEKYSTFNFLPANNMDIEVDTTQTIQRKNLRA